MLFKLIRFWRFDPVTVFYKLGLTNDSSGAASIPLAWMVRKKFEKSGLSDLFQRYGKEIKSSSLYELFLSGHKMADITYVHDLASKSNVVLELGCGVSTVAMAFAMKKKNKGKVYAVETDEKWANVVKNALKKLELSDYCEVIHSASRLHKDGLQIFSLFDVLPNISPDLIYVDGPSPSSVQGLLHGLNMEGLYYIVAADPLLYEWSYYVGTKIIVDGRINNVRFLQNNLKRKYSFKRNYFRNVSIFTLIK
jgi:protein-L-isoaspartate O-methyltransferase